MIAGNAMVRLSVVVGVCAALCLSGGCGEGQTDQPPLNRALGDGLSGAPVRTTAADVGILEDPANYSGQAATVAAQAAASAEEAAEQLMGEAIDAALNLDIIGLLDTIDATRLGPLNDETVKNAIAETFLKLDALLVTISRRLEEPELATWREGYNRMTALLTKNELLDLFHYEALDSENVAITIEPARVTALLERMAPEGAPRPQDFMGGAVGGFSIDLGDPAAQLEAAPALPATLIDGAWKFQPQAPPTDIAPEEIVGSLQTVQTALTTLNEQLNVLDAATLADPNLAGPVLMSSLAPVLFGGMDASPFGPGGGFEFEMNEPNAPPSDTIQTSPMEPESEFGGQAETAPPAAEDEQGAPADEEAADARSDREEEDEKEEEEEKGPPSFEDWMRSQGR